MTLSTEQRFAFWVVAATVLRGWALAEQGQRAEGIAQIRQGLADWRSQERCTSRVFVPSWPSSMGT